MGSLEADGVICLVVQCLCRGASSAAQSKEIRKVNLSEVVVRGLLMMAFFTFLSVGG